MSASFAEFIKILGKGKRGARSLTELEAEHAMDQILAGEVAPEQMGAFWMLIRIREETVAETVGFARSTRRHLRDKGAMHQIRGVALDWPTYAGKRNELPWFLLAALALSHSGVKVLMHGHAFKDDDRLYIEPLLQWLGLPISHSATQAQTCLNDMGFAYIPLTDFAPQLAELMDLKHLLGLRSPVNTLVRLLNPFQAAASVHGVFHKGYDQLHLDVAGRLQDASVLVFRGGNGEAEVNPERDVALGYWQKGKERWQQWPKAEQQHVRQKDNLNPNRLLQHWTGATEDPFGQQAILQTMASVIGLIKGIDSQLECLTLAKTYWDQRDRGLFDGIKVA